MICRQEATEWRIIKYAGIQSPGRSPPPLGPAADEDVLGPRMRLRRGGWRWRLFGRGCGRANLSLVEFRGQVAQRLADRRAQVFRRYEEGGDPLLSYPRFQRLELLGTGSGIEIARPHRMIF